MPDWKHTEQSPGEYLQRRFLEPLKLSASQLARATGMPRSRVSELIAGQRRITADTATRLGIFLGMEPEFWMALQASWDLAHAQVDTSQIEPVDTHGFLIGPGGAQRLTPTPRPSTGPLASMSPEMLERLRTAAKVTPPEGPRQQVHTRYDNGQHAWISKPR